MVRKKTLKKIIIGTLAGAGLLLLTSKSLGAETYESYRQKQGAADKKENYVMQRPLKMFEGAVVQGDYDKNRLNPGLCD